MKKIFFMLLLLSLFSCGIPEKEITPSVTPFSPILSTTNSPGDPAQETNIFIDPNLPSALLEAVILPSSVAKVDAIDNADVQFTFSNEGEYFWLYVVAARFPTVRDGIAFEDIKNLWGGSIAYVDEINMIMVKEGDLVLLEKLLGKADSNTVKIVQQNLLDTTWEDAGSIAIIPFEDLQMRWKVLNLDGMSPLYKDLNIDSYPLLVHYDLFGSEQIISTISTSADFFVPKNNWDPGKMTVLMMTGTSAFVRSVAERMETKGLLYPAEKIRNWLLEPDFTHISNEVSFTPSCPEPDPWNVNLMFCSQPEYISLMEDIDVDIVELTGNHLADYNYEPITYTLELYDQKGWEVFGGGADVISARLPLLLEHNGNKIAIIGCNSVGPQWVWATSTNPGAASCDFEWIESEIVSLKENGYIVFFTLQGEESYDIVPLDYMREDFLRAANYGADVVSGSQAHFPQIIQFHNATFIHYGLGNLFFDQMDYPVVGTRREFLDRYVVYEGKLISVELKTAMLEDWAQPRPMTEDERKEFLSEIFLHSIWQ